jgi:hypothetical protein
VLVPNTLVKGKLDENEGGTPNLLADADDMLLYHRESEDLTGPVAKDQ